MGKPSRIATAFQACLADKGGARRRKKRGVKLRSLHRRSLAIQSLEQRWLMSAEGIAELVELQAQVLDATGYALIPTIVEGVPEYTVATGQKFSIRTRARDLRMPHFGVFSAYTDMVYTTQGNPSTELAQVLWGENLQIRIPKTANGGSFTITNGTESTAAIGFTLDQHEMSLRIKDAIDALSFVGGPTNTRIELRDTGIDFAFEVSFLGSLASRYFESHCWKQQSEIYWRSGFDCDIIKFRSFESYRPSSSC